MIGLYYQQEEDQDIKLYIRYSKTGKEAQKVFNENDEIKLWF